MLCSFAGGYWCFEATCCLHHIVEVNSTQNMETAGLSEIFVTSYKTAWWYNPEDIALTSIAIKNSGPVVLRMLFDI